MTGTLYFSIGALTSVACLALYLLLWNLNGRQQLDENDLAVTTALISCIAVAWPIGIPLTLIWVALYIVTRRNA